MTTRKRAPGKKLDRAALDRLASVFRAFGDATRLALLQELKDRPKNVGELVAVTGTSQANVSRQLKVLHTAGLLHREEADPYVLYTIVDEIVLDICNAACRKLSKAVTHVPIPDSFI